MAVYVDNMKIPFGRMLMSHMAADSLDELHNMVTRIGLRKRWFQDHRIPHYDISQSKKAIAVKLGAIEISSRELIKLRPL